MPSLKEVRNRIKSVQSTQQITKAMKMVAAAKLRKAQDQALQLRPYSLKLNEILSNLASTSETLAENPLTQSRAIKKVLVVLITSDRGLCGPFNSNIFKALNGILADKYASQLNANNISFLTIGKRANEFIAKRYPNLIGEYSTLLQNINFNSVKEAAEYAIEAYKKGEFDVIEIIYNEFKNVATQNIKVEQFLPIVASFEEKGEKKEYIFEPNAEEILTELVPRALKTQFYKAVLESNASEHGARMTAMDKATENAGEMLKELKVTYNRSRQASITKEILEIVAGAEALG